MNDVQDIKIYAKGAAFSDGIYDLRALESLVTNYRIIIDRLVAVQLGRKQVTVDLTKQLNYKVQIKKGSIELFIEFALENKEYFSILSADGGEYLAKGVVKLYRDAIALREKASEFIENKKPFSINIVNSFNINSRFASPNVSFDQNSGQIFLNDPKILYAAQSTRSPINNMLSKVDGEQIEYIDISNSEQHYKITPEHQHIVGSEKEELPTKLNIVGRLDMVAFSSHSGTLVSEGDKYNVSWDEEIRSKIQQSVDIEGVTYTVKPVIDKKRLDNETISFHILDCQNSQNQLQL